MADEDEIPKLNAPEQGSEEGLEESPEESLKAAAEQQPVDAEEAPVPELEEEEEDEEPPPEPEPAPEPDTPCKSVPRLDGHIRWYGNPAWPSLFLFCPLHKWMFLSLKKWVT